MKIIISSDHAGYRAKQKLIKHLLEQGHEVADCGPFSEESCDYPDYAAVVAKAVGSGKAPRGVLLCGTGIGMSLVANRFGGVRCALVHDEATTTVCRTHNNANIIAMGARLLDDETITRLTEIFLSVDFEDGRHDRRLDKTMSYNDFRNRERVPDPPPFVGGDKAEKCDAMQSPE